MVLALVASRESLVQYTMQGLSLFVQDAAWILVFLLSQCLLRSIEHIGQCDPHTKPLPNLTTGQHDTPTPLCPLLLSLPIHLLCLHMSSTIPLILGSFSHYPIPVRANIPLSWLAVAVITVTAFGQSSNDVPSGRCRYHSSFLSCISCNSLAIFCAPSRNEIGTL